MATPDQAERESVALQMALAANLMMAKFKLVAAESGKTWIFHMALYIAPRQVARSACLARLPRPFSFHLRAPCVCRYGNLWAFSTAKLESRGKRMKKVARKQTSSRKTSTATKTITKKHRGGPASKKGKKPQVTTYEVHGYKGNKCLSMLGKTTYREERLFADVDAPHHRKREQLLNIGKILVPRKVKQDQQLWGDKIPSGIDRTVVGLLVAMVEGRIQPLYSIEGKYQA